jgi:hypothetical protein
LRQFVFTRKTINELAQEHGHCVNWIRKELRAVSIFHKVPEPLAVVVVADCVFFKRSYGLLVFRDTHRHRNLYWHELQTETISDYQRGREYLQSKGFIIQAIVIDGRPGVRALFSDIPVQMCHFHQKAIVNRYLTRRPKLHAGKELRSIAMTLCDTNEEGLSDALKQWHERWQSFLKERTVNPDSKRWHYTHKRLRAAYRSLKNNLPLLFTYQKYPELNIPNTTNSLDGLFSHLKGLIRVHRGLKADLKRKIIDYFLQN